ncbi:MULTISPECIES: Lar family restriction alleviation protein [Chelativorans]|jgi:Lar family restriction alleviation protein|uniref:Lar family restriction alleviation protein n=1 Tax=Chelativorans TaxID=449972 RepID=UPI00059F4F3C
MPYDRKPCPFCGSRRTQDSASHYGFVSIYFVVCRDCHADGPAKDTRSEAIQAWNTRVYSHDGDGHA